MLQVYPDIINQSKIAEDGEREKRKSKKKSKSPTHRFFNAAFMKKMKIYFAHCYKFGLSG